MKRSQPCLPALDERIRRRAVSPGQVVAWWLGGAGFVFKTAQGTRLYIDPYLSDVVNDIFGQPRAFPPPLTAEQAQPDVLLCTHWHEDHLDPGSLPAIARNHPEAVLLMPPSALSRAVSWGVPRRQITPLKADQTVELRDLRISTVAARHNAGVEGWEVHDGVCLVMEIEGIRIFFSGDTEYDTRLRRLRPLGIQVAFLSINGVGGNMNAHEAALLAWQWGATTLIPMHHHLWKNPGDDPEATLDPALLQQTYSRLGGRGRVIAPVVGAEIVLGRKRTAAGTSRASAPGSRSRGKESRG